MLRRWQQLKQFFKDRNGFEMTFKNIYNFQLLLCLMSISFHFLLILRFWHKYTYLWKVYCFEVQMPHFAIILSQFYIFSAISWRVKQLSSILNPLFKVINHTLMREKKHDMDIWDLIMYLEIEIEM
jgi:hypothetical protein